MDIPKLKKGGVFGVVFACWVAPKVKDPFYRAMALIDRTLVFIEQNRKTVSLVRNYSDLRDDRINIILGVEGGHIFDRHPVQFRTLYRLGVRVYTLTWNNSNRLAHSAFDGEHLGLTKLGREYLKLMGRARVLLDLSHASTRTAVEVCRISPVPPIASHSCVRALNNFVRNISETALRAIGRRGGLCAVNFSRRHLGQHSVAEHLRHIIKTGLVGSAAIGSDFDGVNDPIFPNIGHAQALSHSLIKQGFSHREVERIFYRNFLGLFRKVCG